MSKLKTIALAAGFTALSGNALARETPAESRDSVSTTPETVIQNQPERKTYAISDKTLRFRTIRDEVKNIQYASKSLNNDGTVFIGVQENGQQESRSVVFTEEYGAVGIRKIGDKTLISNKLGDFFHDNASGRIDFNSKEGLSAVFFLDKKNQVRHYFSEEIILQGDLAGMINKSEQAHEGKIASAIKNHEMVKIENGATLDITKLLQKQAERR